MKKIQLTKLEGSFKNKTNFKLGSWCINYKNFNNKKIKVNEYHWNNRKKLYKDYTYLIQIKKKILQILRKKLNIYHRQNYSLVYWQILLDPYLTYLISVFFDRWEIIHTLKGKFLYPYFNYEKKTFQFDDTEDFIKEISTNDHINQHFFQEIINFKFYKKFKILEKIKVKKIKEKAFRLKKLKKKNEFLKRLLAKKNKILFFDTYFNSKSFYFLNLKLKQTPINLKVQDIFPKTISKKKIDHFFRKDILNDFKPKNNFERFLKKFLGNYLLKEVIEDYSINAKKIKSINLNPKIIVCSGSHVYSSTFKHWIAKQVNQEIKFFINEHGGSFRAARHLFHFEEEISDRVLTWHLPYTKNQSQLPAQTLLNLKKIDYKKNNKCLVIPNRVTRYIFRAEFYPMTGNNYNLINFCEQIVKKMPLKIKNDTLIKLHPHDNDNFWKNYKIYETFLNKKNVVSDNSMKKYFEQAKVVICLYPETSLSQSIIYNIPTILVYPKEMYETHKKLKKIIKLMKKQKIIFDSAKLAIDHLNNIWDNPTNWWEKKSVQNVIEIFKKEVLGINSKIDNIDKWKNFLITSL